MVYRPVSLKITMGNKITRRSKILLTTNHHSTYPLYKSQENDLPLLDAVLPGILPGELMIKSFTNSFHACKPLCLLQ